MQQSSNFNAEYEVLKLIKLRDKIKELEDQQKEALRPYKELQARLEGTILGYLQEVNAKNISTTCGTVSVLRRKSASLEDPAAFMDYVVDNERFDLLDRKANTNAVEDFIEMHGLAPPGVKFSTALTLGVRRK